jgi:tRNA (guanine-N7-)-methyltransferase
MLQDQLTRQTSLENPRRQINITTELKRQSVYTLALNGEFSKIAFDEIRAPKNHGQWRSQVLGLSESVPMDLEVGTGNGLHFAHYACKTPDRAIVGVELKYKPLIQTIRRAVEAGAKNVAIARYHAFNLDQLFTDGEINNVFVHFPDPWTSPRKPKNRFISRENLDLLHRLQRPGSYIDLKTDSREYHFWALEEIRESKYKIIFETQDLHQSEYAAENFMTGFEQLFLRKGYKINSVRLLRE